MIDEPGCSAGNVISARPVLGPEDSSRRSLLMRMISRARLRKAELTDDIARLDCIAEIVDRHELLARNAREVRDSFLTVLGMSVDAGADSRAAESNFTQELALLLQGMLCSANGSGVGCELLP